MGNELALQEQRIGQFRGTLLGSLKAITSLLPANMRPERVARIALTELQKQPKLLNCNPQSFLLAVLGSCALGLELGGPMGQAYLVPYGETCQLIPGYRGLIKLATNAGNVSRISAEVVRVGDAFEFQEGTDPKLVHVRAEAPILADGTVDPKWQPGDVRSCYAVAFFSDGTTLAVIMHRWEIDRIRDMSQGYQNAVKYKKTDNPWMQHYAEMGKKTAIRRLSKLLPASSEKLLHAVAIEEAAEVGKPQGLLMLPDMPEMPELEPQPQQKQETTPSATAEPEKSPEDKRKQSAMQGLIIELGKRGVKDRDASLTWINARISRKITSRKELTEQEIASLMGKLDERQPGDE
jgi:recombination protein RecT